MSNELNLLEDPKDISDEDPVDYEWIYPTFHLGNFDHLKRATGLYGEHLKPIIKAIWYVLHGQIIKEITPRLGDIETDCRMNFAFVLPSGYGKKNIEDTIVRACEGLGEKVVKPTSYHPEQLVGKTLRLKDKEGVFYEHIKGHLADDVIIFDDAIDLVKGKEANYRESRKYLITALDTIGKNLLTKKMVNIPREEMLSYYPHCTAVLFYQPFILSEEIVLTGLFRRFLTQSLEFSDKDRSKEFFQKVDGTTISQNEAMTALVTNLKRLKDDNESLKSSDKGSPIFTKEAREKFKDLHLLLVEFGESFSPKVSNLIEMIAFSLQTWLLKMAVILANSQGKREIGVFEVEMAFADLMEFLHSNFNFVERKVKGSLDYGEKWNGATGDDLEILKWLHDKNALSEKTSKVTIKTYIEKIAEVLGIKVDAARKRYQKHKSQGWIKGKQISSHETVVFLTYAPLMKKVSGKGDRVIRAYREIIVKNAPCNPPPGSSITDSPSMDGEEFHTDSKKEKAVSPCHPVSPAECNPLTLQRGLCGHGLMIDEAKIILGSDSVKVGVIRANSGGFGFREKYRPQRFSDIVGNRRTIQTLKNMVKAEIPPKSLLFWGPAGTGKTSFSLLFGKAINCENFVEDVCGVCQSCRTLKSLSSATGIWGLPRIVDCTKINKSDLEKILNSFRFVCPSKAGRHILIFDEFHRLTWRLEDELLIPLEKQNNIILAFCLIDLKKVSQPLLQRVAVLETGKPEIEELIPWLKKICDTEGIQIIDPESLGQIALEADRLPRECLSILETIYYLGDGLTIDLVGEVVRKRRGIGNNESEQTLIED